MSEGALPRTADVVVAGSGASGLLAATIAARAGLSVVLVETSRRIGGTSALSGGRIWVPGHAKSEAPQADREAAERYLLSLLPAGQGVFLDAFLGTAPEMIRFVEQATGLDFEPCANYPDYHPGLRGWSSGGRCLDPRPVDRSALRGPQQLVLEPPGYLPITHSDWERWRVPAAYDRELLRERYDSGVRTGGVGLVSSLLSGAIDAGVRICLGTRLVDVRLGTDGGVEAAAVERGGVRSRIAAGEVVLASGGFDRDPELVDQHLPAGITASGSSPHNRGDALAIARRAGAATANLREGWWMPMIQVDGDEVEGAPYPRSLVRERGTPRQIIVGGRGERVVNEAAPYNELGKNLNAAAERLGDAGFHIVFDEGFRRQYAMPGLPAAGPLPDFIATAATLEDLAARIGLDPQALTTAVERWNELCELGEDLDFGRGNSTYDRFYGDPRLKSKQNLGPISESPYYAIKLYSGTIGSKGGPVTDRDARVLRSDGTAIRGLYAVGNASAFWVGDAYPGPGATLAVGMTMAYRAGRAIEASAESR